MIARDPDTQERLLTDTVARLLSGPVPPRQALTVRAPPFVIISEVGLVRKDNQDRAIAIQFGGLHPDSPGFTCFAVSDGMGGMLEGEECAIITLSAFASHLVVEEDRATPDRLLKAARSANLAVHAYASGRGGATLSAVIVDAVGRLWTLNVGDSRIYTVARGQRKLERATTDDTLKEAFGGQSGELVQFMGIGPALLPNIRELSPDIDQVFITSDGAHYFTQDLLQELVSVAGDPKRAPDRIVALARWLGGPDNATIIAFRPSDVLADQNARQSALHIWTPLEAISIILPPQPLVNGSPVSPPREIDQPSSSQKSNKRRASRSKIRRDGKSQRAEARLPELIVTVSTDEPPDAADR